MIPPFMSILPSTDVMRHYGRLCAAGRRFSKLSGFASVCLSTMVNCSIIKYDVLTYNDSPGASPTRTPSRSGVREHKRRSTWETCLTLQFYQYTCVTDLSRSSDIVSNAFFAATSGVSPVGLCIQRTAVCFRTAGSIHSQ